MHDRWDLRVWMPLRFEASSKFFWSLWVRNMYVFFVCVKFATAATCEIKGEIKQPH
jgi:hypothetical protein